MNTEICKKKITQNKKRNVVYFKGPFLTRFFFDLH